jgi:hypothetical protein
MLGALEARTRQRIEDWAERKVHDENLEERRFREDRTNYLRESALAIGSAVAEHGLRLRDGMVLRSLFAWFHMMRLTPIIYAPGLHAKDVDLRSERLPYAVLSGADLVGANLVGANLLQADLHQANLAGALLIGTRLFGANLQNANLQNATLQHANNLTAAQLRTAKNYPEDLLRELEALEAAKLASAEAPRSPDPDPDPAS